MVKDKTFGQTYVLLAVLGAAACICGCSAPWNPWPLWHHWLDPTKNIAVDDEAELMPIFHQKDPIEDYREFVPNAEPPTLADLEWTEEDYVIGPGDVVNISVLDLYAEGVESTVQRMVSNEGYISMPLVPGRIGIGGMTGSQALEVVINVYKTEDLLPNPSINLQVAGRRQNYFSVVGAVAQPNIYGISRKEFRVLEAITNAGYVVQANLEYLYVVRRTDASKEFRRAATVAVKESVPTRLDQLPPLPGIEPLAPGVGPALEPKDTEVDVVEDLMKVLRAKGLRPATTPAAAPATAPATGAATAPAAGADRPAVVPALEELQALQNVMPGAQPRPATQPAKPTVMGMTEMAQSGGGAPASAGQSPPQAQPPAMPDIDPDDPFGWVQGNMSNLVRIIVISLPRLMEGDARQNIIIRDGDTIIVPGHKVGEFYVTGQVRRPGVYNLTARKITVKMALTAAGGFDPLAWPSNSVLIRRIGKDQELTIPLRLDQIMAGKEPDFFIQPDDVIAVGTHIAAPFLAVTRNAFRMTYGFGFIYDRNFAETNFGQWQSLQDAADNFFDSDR